ncbi:hypothetical protein EUGRSUZ_F01471 [Eucalyptus grandis]|uniref:GIR1-like zinc ribbon domain-containing protein n=2 Tax=Eucalyptus grandis TaxID=71139 RepID=A0A059BNX3_EUCGR|nr:hypothetical protein EUGRSUZ_F01471 [Eucalyptus grandis]
MAAEVSMSRVVEFLKKKDDDKPQPVPLLMLHHHLHGPPGMESAPPMTRDLLGLEFQSSHELVDLDLHVPSGWEKRLDLKSGKVYIQRCSPQALPSTSNHKHQPINSAPPQFQDLNFPPSPSKLAFNGSDDAFLDLKLLTSSSPSTSCNYQSVCTLDKVKSALERADRGLARKRSPFWKSSSSPLNSLTSSSIKEAPREEDSSREMSAVAAGCPSCLLYVLISRDNPKCPRCNSVVPMPSSKKPRIDLNISI